MISKDFICISMIIFFLLNRIEIFLKSVFLTLKCPKFQISYQAFKSNCTHLVFLLSLSNFCIEDFDGFTRFEKP